MSGTRTETAGGRRLRNAAGVSVALALLAVMGDAVGAEPEPHVKRIRVPLPADRLGDWLNDGWVPTTAGALQRRLQRARRDPAPQRTAWIERMEYAARVEGESLVDGTLRGRVMRSPEAGPDPALLDLGPLDLGVSRLEWQDGPAVWGGAPGGSQTLRVDGEHHALQGEWALSGRKMASAVEFRMSLARATSSTIRLQVPRGEAVGSSAGTVRGPAPTPDEGWAEWTIDLGEETSCRLIVFSKGSTDEARPLILFDRHLNYVVRPEGLRFRFELQADVVRSSVDRLFLQLPRQMAVYSVELGSGTPLVWNESRSGGRRLAVRLPEPVRDRRFSIVLTGAAPTRLAANWRLPGVDLVPRGGPNGYDTAFLTGSVQVSVVQSLQTVGLQTEGLRQVVPSTDSPTADVVAFEQFAGDGHLTLTVDYPATSFSADAHTVLRFGPNEWRLTAAIRWTGRSGHAFRTRCVVPRGWQVTAVRAPDEGNRTALDDWQLLEEGGRRILLLELGESLSAGTSLNVVVEARRRPPRVTDSLPLPLVEPLDAATVDAVFSTSREAAYVPSARFERLDEEHIAGLVDPTLLSAALPEEERAGLVHYAVTSPRARLVHAGHSEVVGRAETVIELGGDAVRQFVELSVIANDRTIDGFVVTGSAGVSTRSWELLEPRAGRLDVQPLSEAARSERGLREEQSAWQVRLPYATSERIRVRVRAEERLAAGRNVPLFVLPDAAEFQGQVDVRTKSDTEFEVRPGVGTRPVPVEVDEPYVRRFEYGAQTGPLKVVRQPPAGVPPPVPPTARLELRTVLPDTGERLARHTARYRIGSPNAAGWFEYRLPPDGRLVEARLAGRPVQPRNRRGWAGVPLPWTEEAVTVTLQYDAPVTAPRFQAGGWSTFSAPEVVHRVVGFDWSVVVPQRLAVDSAGAGLTFDDVAVAPSWTRRLFGPLGRRAGKAVFNPFLRDAWLRLAGGSGTKPASDGADPQAAPAGWRTYRLSGPAVPEDLRLRIWNRPLLDHLAWFALAGCFFTSLMFRIWGGGLAGRAAVGWIAACMGAMWLVPSVLAAVVGGALTGSLAAIVLPGRLLFGRPPQDERPSLTSRSTESYRVVPASCLLLAGGLAASLALPAAGVADPAPLPTADAQDDDPAPPRLTVLIPEADASTPQDERVVYTSRDLAEWLATFEEEPSAAPTWLLQSASYEGRLEEGSVTVTATYEVVLFGNEPTTRVRFPLTGANLGGPRACLVDGEPAPVLQTAGEKALEVALQRRTPDDPYESFDVTFELRPAVEKDGARRGFEVGVPPVLDSRVSFESGRPETVIRVPTARSTTHANGRWQGLLGRSDVLRVAWSPGNDPEPPPGEADYRVRARVDLTPSRLDVLCRLRVSPQSGELDHVQLRIPPGMVFRGVSAEGLLHHVIHHRRNGAARLLAEFEEPRSEEFTLDLDLTVPVPPQGEGLVIPPLSFVAEGDPSQPVMRHVESLVGVAAPEEFELESEVTAGAATPVAVEEFQSAIPSRTDGPPPRLVFRLEQPAELPFQLALLKPRREVEQVVVYHVDRGTVTWTARARVRTSMAPAFRHRIALPNHYRIESAAVIQDEADRLERWTRLGNSVELVLVDRTTSEQEIVLRGTLPVSAGGTVALPPVLVGDAETSSYVVEVRRDDAVGVDVVQPAELDSAGEPGDRAAPATGERVGRFLLQTPPPTIKLNVGAVPKPTSARVAHRLVADDTGATGVLTAIRFDHGADFPGPLRVVVPPSVQAFDVLQSPPGLVTSPREDGPTVLVVRPAHGTRSDVVVRTPAAIGGDDGWTAVVPRPQVTEVTERTVLLPADFPWVVEEAPRAAKPTGDWAALLGRPNGDTVAYAADSDRWRLVPRQKDDGGPRAHLVLHDLTPSGGVRGRSIFLATGRGALAIETGADVTLSAVEVGGSAVEVAEDAEGALRIPLPDESNRHVVTVHWSTSRGTGLPVGRITLPLPSPAGSESVPALVRVRVPRSRLVFGGGLSGKAATRRMLEQFEADRAAELDVRRFLNDWLAGTTDAAARTGVDDGFADLSAARGTLLVPDREGEARFWLVDVRPAVVAGGLVTFVLVWLALARLVRPGWGGWWQKHTAATWGVVGLVWWLWLTPSVVGFLLLLVAGWLAVREVRRPRSPEAAEPA